MNSFRFCISEKIYRESFISRKVISLSIEFQVYRVFSFKTFKTLFHCNFFQRGMHFFLCFSVYHVFFHLATFMIYFLLLILSNSIMVFFDVICFRFLVFEVHWNSWISWFIILPNLEIVGYQFFNYFSSPISLGISVIHVLDTMKLSHISLMIFVFFLNSFSLCFFLVSVAMSSSLLNFSFAIHNLIHPSSVFLISAIVVFIFRSLRLYIFHVSTF